MEQEINDILNKLVALGEDKDELEYWCDILPDLPEEEQMEVLDLFKMELEQLSAIQ